MDLSMVTVALVSVSLLVLHSLISGVLDLDLVLSVFE